MSDQHVGGQDGSKPTGRDHPGSPALRRLIEQARYLFDLSHSPENSPGVRAPRLPAGDLIMLNNRFWLHGRAPFHCNEQLHRGLMRLRGAFAEA